jgi:hypothetical protein
MENVGMFYEHLVYIFCGHLVDAWEHTGRKIRKLLGWYFFIKLNQYCYMYQVKKKF